ncbi:hypothetical protein [Streptomyces varsoviensis]|uniref:hypothetical protein n=1 Tax=Streptomyces varsoviensis TaxID=67373 RepID=UPI000662AEE5|nr:hypothetical protein [Streptomyces varsoviensis]
MIALVLMGLLVMLARACESMKGGPVRSKTAYEEHVAATKGAGMRTVSQLRPAPRLAGALPGASLESTADVEGSTSCVDDFGADSDGVTRGQPIYYWKLEFDSRRDYLTAVHNLREEWERRELTVKESPGPAAGRPGQGLPAISTTDEHGVDVMFGPDRYSGAPIVWAEGDCVRHTDR